MTNVPLKKGNSFDVKESNKRGIPYRTGVYHVRNVQQLWMGFL